MNRREQLLLIWAVSATGLAILLARSLFIMALTAYLHALPWGA